MSRLNPRRELRDELGGVHIRDEARIVDALLALGLLRFVLREDLQTVVGHKLDRRDLVLVQQGEELIIADLHQIGLGDGGVERVDEQRADQRGDDQKQDPAAGICAAVRIAAVVVILIFGGVAHKSTFFPERYPVDMPRFYHICHPFTRTAARAGGKFSVNLKSAEGCFLRQGLL